MLAPEQSRTSLVTVEITSRPTFDSMSLIVEPECVRMVQAEVCTRIPIVNTLCRNVPEHTVYHDWLWDSGYDANREYLVGSDFEHAPPYSGSSSGGRLNEPTLVELQ